MAKFLVGKQEIDTGRYEVINNHSTFSADHIMFEGKVRVLDEVEDWDDPAFPYITIIRSNVKSVCGIQLSMEEAKQLIIDLGLTIDKIEAEATKAKQAS